MNNQSVVNKVTNDNLGNTIEMVEIVKHIYQTSHKPLTTNEMLSEYYNRVNTIPASHPDHKILLSARHNGLKAARTQLTHDGILREIGTKICEITKRRVSLYKYVGVEYTEQEKIQQELQRRLEDKVRIEEKIQELRQELAKWSYDESRMG